MDKVLRWYNIRELKGLQVSHESAITDDYSKLLSLPVKPTHHEAVWGNGAQAKHSIGCSGQAGHQEGKHRPLWGA